jgi:RimJ/RimL family protein N-acetyltransferase
VIELAPFGAKHFDPLIAWSPDASTLLQWAGTGLRYPLTPEQLAKLVTEAEAPGSTARLYAALSRRDRALVGHGELGWLDRHNGSAKLMRIVLAPEARGRGLGAALVRELVRVGFEDLGLNRLDLHVFPFNRQAIACYERVGFRLEGTLRQARRHGDEYWDVCVMGLLRAQWNGA